MKDFEEFGSAPTLAVDLGLKEQKRELTEIVVRAMGGDRAAFSELVLEYQLYVRAYIAKRTSHFRDVDDLAQEAFVIAYRKISTLDEPSAFRSWLTSIASNLLRNHNRKKRAALLSDAEELERLIDSQIENSGEDNWELKIEVLKQCIQKLDKGYQELLEAHYVSGLSIKELTRKYSVKHSTLTMRLHRCREALRVCVDKNWG